MRGRPRRLKGELGERPPPPTDRARLSLGPARPLRARCQTASRPHTRPAADGRPHERCCCCGGATCAPCICSRAFALHCMACSQLLCPWRRLPTASQTPHACTRHAAVKALVRCMHAYTLFASAARVHECCGLDMHAGRHAAHMPLQECMYAGPVTGPNAPLRRGVPSSDRQRGLQGATKTGGGGKQGNERHRREPQEDRKRG